MKIHSKEFNEKIRELEQLTMLYTMQFNSRVRQRMLEQERIPSDLAPNEAERQQQLEKETKNYSSTEEFKRQVKLATYRLCFYNMQQVGLGSERLKAAKAILREEQRADLYDRISKPTSN